MFCVFRSLLLSFPSTYRSFDFLSPATQADLKSTSRTVPTYLTSAPFTQVAVSHIQDTAGFQRIWAMVILWLCLVLPATAQLVHEWTRQRGGARDDQAYALQVGLKGSSALRND